MSADCSRRFRSSVLISVHIPKTGGTTFRELLQAHFQREICLHYYRPHDCAMTPIAEIPAEVRCIHGHFTARKFSSINFPDAVLVTWLRDPVERVVSEFEHLRRSPDPNSGLSRLIQAGGGLAEFAEHPYARNTLARYIDGRVLSDFAFMGISEDFDRELDRFAEITGIRLGRGHRSNVNPHKSAARYDLPGALRTHIEALNTADRELYETCRANRVGKLPALSWSREVAA